MKYLIIIILLSCAEQPVYMEFETTLSSSSVVEDSLSSSSQNGLNINVTFEKNSFFNDNP